MLNFLSTERDSALPVYQANLAEIGVPMCSPVHLEKGFSDSL